MQVRRRLGLALAGLAIALHAFWPLIAQAKPKSVALIPVCTIGGETHYAEVPLGNGPAEERSTSHFEHCSLCTLGADRATLPVFVFSVDLENSSTSQWSAEAFTFHTVSAVFANPRAPPFFQSVDFTIDQTGRTHEEASAVRHRGAGADAADIRHRLVRLGILLA